MALIAEVAEKIYEIKPDGKEIENFPLCTVYLVVDDKIALVETGLSVQIPDILEAVDKLGYDINDETVGNILKRHGILPAPERGRSPRWRYLMSHYKDQILACDFFTVETLFLKQSTAYSSLR